MTKLTVLTLTMSLAACGHGGKDSFKDECSLKKQKKTMTVRGVFLRPSRGNLFLDCDDPGRTYEIQHGGASRGCALPFYTKEGGKAPPITMFLPLGNGPHQLKPMPERFEWQHDIHVNTDDGHTAELGDIVEVTGELDTTDDCEMAHITNVKLIEDKY
jgi:hypothetical protein